MPELSKGIQLADRYTLLRQLGGTGGSRIWLAKDRLTDASIVLKLVARESEAAIQLRKEWQTSIKLMHAHIGRVFEFHSDTDWVFFSQQYFEGPDIGVLAGSSPQDILGPVGLITDAMQYVHARGIVHRDIKASNILLDRNGAPYLIDFGVSARIGEQAGGGSDIARSPQSLEGQDAAPQDDIFALGGLIYELVSGSSPYSAATVDSDIRLRKADALVAAAGTPLPQGLVDLVAAMLEKDASLRPDAEAVGRRLRECGFEPGVAASLTGRATAIDEAAETIVPQKRTAQTDVVDQAEVKTGIQPATVAVALSALLAVLLVVIFYLPDLADSEAQRASNEVVVLDGAGGDADRIEVDPDVRRRLQSESELPSRSLSGENITFSENKADYSGLDEQGRARYQTELTLGELLSSLEVLEGRGVERWAPVEYRTARDLYQKGDQAYLGGDFGYAQEAYLGAISELEPLYERIQPAFDEAFLQAAAAFDRGDRLEALRLYELAVAITPTHPEALAGLERTSNLERVMRLVDQGLELEEDLELDAAEKSFAEAVALDELWAPAHEGLERVRETRTKMEFDTRMSEGFEALSAGDYLAARAAFRVAQRLIPESSEPADGLLQIEQGLQLQQIASLEQEILSLERDEHWDAVVTTYEELLQVDSTLSFATEGLANAREMSTLHKQLDKFIADPDRLSSPSVMQEATLLVVDITRRPNVGERLGAQRDELSRLLKRAVTPLTVPMISDNMTQVSIYRVGRLGSFLRTEVSLRPGTYVAVGVREGYRDVRREFRVAPEIEMDVVIVRCEEPI